MVTGSVALGEAIAALSDANINTEMMSAQELFFFMNALAPLSQAWSAEWTKLAEQYYADSLHAVTDPSYAATAAGDYAKYQEAIAQGQREMGYQDSMLQTQKNVLQVTGNAMSQIYTLAEGPIEENKALNRAILLLGTPT